MPDARSTVEVLKRLDALNRSMGAVERRRGLHYWLGFEYALALQLLTLPVRARLLDIGTGPWSIWPYAAAHLLEAEVTAIDLDPGFSRQTAMRERAVAAGLCHPDQVMLVRADARRLPFPDECFDGCTAISSLEHVEDRTGDRVALKEVYRVVRPGGVVIASVPFRAEGSMAELDETLALYQRHYSERTLAVSLIEPSGLQEVDRVYYGECRPVFQTLKRLPGAVERLLRPWNAALAARFMRRCRDTAGASAVMVKLQKPER
jgi:ubiquinone/menaquinone biosynthesis C-methylase UbiE